MSPEGYRLVTTGHLLGNFAWLAGLAACLVAGDAHRRRAGLFMDVGATLAIACGVVLMLVHEPPLMKAGWFHAKMALLLVFIGLHGFLRMQMAKIRKGKAERIPGWIGPVVAFIATGIVFLVINKPF